MGRYDKKRKKRNLKKKFKIIGLSLSVSVLAFILLFNSFNSFNKKDNIEIVKNKQIVETLSTNKTSKIGRASCRERV